MNGIYSNWLTATLRQLNETRFPPRDQGLAFVNNLVGGEINGLTEGVRLCSLCSSGLSCGGLSWASDSDYLQTVLWDRELLFRAYRLSIIFLWLKILQSWSKGRGCFSAEWHALSPRQQKSHQWSCTRARSYFCDQSSYLWPKEQMAGAHVAYRTTHCCIVQS